MSDPLDPSRLKPGPAATGAASAARPRKLPLHPGHPERICWGCEKYCPANDMACGNGTERGQHPIEIFGPDWTEMGLDAGAADASPPSVAPAVSKSADTKLADSSSAA